MQSEKNPQQESELIHGRVTHTGLTVETEQNTSFSNFKKGFFFIFFFTTGSKYEGSNKDFHRIQQNKMVMMMMMLCEVCGVKLHFLSLINL